MLVIVLDLLVPLGRALLHGGTQVSAAKIVRVEQKSREKTQQEGRANGSEVYGEDVQRVLGQVLQAVQQGVNALLRGFGHMTGNENNEEVDKNLRYDVIAPLFLAVDGFIRHGSHLSRSSLPVTWELSDLKRNV